MDLAHGSLLAAGIIGGSVAVVHSVLVHRFWIARPGARADATPVVQRLTPPLLQFSGFNWFVCGLALIGVGLGLWPQASTAICVLVASSYLYGAVANLWATRGRHPGWALYAVALGLIAFGVWRMGQA